MKTKATKLLAVVAIATGPGLVAANPRANEARMSEARTTASRANEARTNEPGGNHSSRANAVDPWDPPRDPWNAERAIDPDRLRASLAQLEGTIALVTARPRQMPSGAPACGNVATRAPRPADCRPVPPPTSGAILANAPENAPTNAPTTNVVASNRR